MAKVNKGFGVNDARVPTNCSECKRRFTPHFVEVSKNTRRLCDLCRNPKGKKKKGSTR